MRVPWARAHQGAITDEFAATIIDLGMKLADTLAGTERRARSALAEQCYPKAPVDAWPLLMTRVASRHALSASLVSSAAQEKP